MDEDEPSSSTSTSVSTASISITPLAGSQTSSRALCHLLEFDDAKILLDCGINPRREEFTYDDYSQDRIDYLERLKELAPQLTLVLLSAPTIETLGLLPYLVSKLRLACPIYATFQCRTLGQLTLEEWVGSRTAEEGDPTGPVSSSHPPSTPVSAAGPGKRKPQGGGDKDGKERADDVAWRVTKEEIQLSFSRITPVVYSQIVRVAGRSNSPFSLLAHPSGTYLGGTLWSLRSATTDSLLYSPFFNHVNERTLDLAAFMIKGKEGRNEVNEAMRRVGVLVIGAERSLVTATKAKERDRAFLELINSTLEASSSILIPTDSAGRFMELLVLLEQHWAFSRLSQRFPLILLARNASDILSTIRSLADSFGGQLGKDEAERERVLRFANVRVVHSLEHLHSLYPVSAPKLILSAPSSLAYGLSRHALVSIFIQAPKALVLLTTPGTAGSLASHLFSLWNDRQPAATRYGSGRVGAVVDFGSSESSTTGALTTSTHLRLKMRKKVVLQGEELMAYLEEERVGKEREMKAKAMAERNRRMMEADDDDGSSGDSDSSDDEEGGDKQAVTGDGADEDGRPRQAKREGRDLESIIKDGEAGQGAGIGPASYAEPGSGPAERAGGGRKRYGLGPDAGVASSGAWDEFLDDTRGTTIGGFDIYARQHAGNVLPGSGGGAGGHATSHLTNMANQTRFRMFPFFERRRRIDGYGEYIDVEGWKTRGKAPEEIEAVLAATDNALGKRKRQEVEEQEKAKEPPHKFVAEDVTVEVRCKVLAIDMEGKADGRALRSILPLIEPKKLVLINGDTEATQDLAAALQSSTGSGLGEENIFSPGVGEKTKIADVTKSFSVRLDDSLMTALALRKIDEYEVVPVRGIIGQSDESTVPVLVPSTHLSGAQNEPAGIADATSADGADMSDARDGKLPALPAPHFVGDIKLALLKNSLSGKGVPVSFHKGTLICGPVKAPSAPTATSKAKEGRAARLAKLTGGRPSSTPELEDVGVDGTTADTSGGKVVVRKEGTQLVLEGAPGDTFYAVREAVYAMHAVAS